MDRVVVADVGSTTTKAVLFRRDGPDGSWSLHRREAPTTVEAPHADVAVGLRAAIASLAEATGERLWADDRPAVPLLLTSSAGGGLAMVVTGLVREVTSQSAERAALDAIAIVAVFLRTLLLGAWIVEPGFLGGQEALLEVLRELLR